MFSMLSLCLAVAAFLWALLFLSVGVRVLDRKA